MKKNALCQTASLSFFGLVVALLFSSCGRTPLLDPVCALAVAPSSLEFGEVEVGKQVDLSVTLSSGNGSVCHVSGLGLKAGTDSSFSVADRTPTELTLHANEKASIHIIFKPAEVKVPLLRTGTLAFSSDDPAHGTMELPLTGQIHSDCRLAVMPTDVSFGKVAIGESATASVHVMNTGSAACDVGQIALAPGSDPQFAVDDAGFIIAPGAEGTITTSFRARDTSLPRHRTGQLTFGTTDPKQAKVSIPLAADITVCSLAVDPDKLDFGEVAPGAPVTLGLNINSSNEGAVCVISSISLRPDSDAGFTVEPDAPVGVALAPGTQNTVSATFNPARVTLPLQRYGILVLTTNDPLHPTVEVPLAARIRSECRLTVVPESLNFGQVMIDTTATGAVRIINSGKGPCEITGMGVTLDSDSQFALGSRETDSFTIDAGSERTVTVTFHAVDPAEPHHRTGRLVFASTDPQRENITVPLSADVDLGCVLKVNPTSVDFGSPVLNTRANASVALINQGTQPCVISGLSMKPGSDSGFALGESQPSSLVVPVGDKQTVALRFDALDSSPPHQKNATLLIDSNDHKNPQIAVPLTATIDTVCVEASRWIYTVDSNGTFSRFDPSTQKFTDISTLRCSTSSTPFSMAVDQNAMAWVLYGDGKLYKVDTTTAKCESTSFQNSQFQEFGMGFVFDPSTNKDTLYIAGGPNLLSPCILATVSFPSLQVTSLGQVKEGSPELSGTGDGSLWGFYPADNASSGGHQAALVRLDPSNGAALETYHYANITETGSWAMKFWGGQFWIFVEGSIYAVDRDKPQTAKSIMTNSGRRIVGAGVSTCAPLKGN
jgi:hypothetical protein